MMNNQPPAGDQSKPHGSGATSGVDPHSFEYAPYPKLDPEDVQPPADPLIAHPPPLPGAATSMPAESNPYITTTPAPASSSKNPMDSMKSVLENWGKKASEATKKAENLAGNMWQHLKTSPSIADAAVARIAQGTKVIAEGGYEKVFRQTFETTPQEQLKKYYACYLSTSAGPVMGTLYLSTAKLAFCSDNPLSYKVGDKTEWSYYKVVLPLNQVTAVNTSTSKANAAEKYIQIITGDNHEFWFMGFVYYDSAVRNLQGATGNNL
ncbi:hypothetical protein V2J09_013868 [Rumex salicifolius]